MAQNLQAVKPQATELKPVNGVEMVQNMTMEHLSVTQAFFKDVAEELDAFATRVAEALMNGNKLLLCGNGGSASDAQHIAAEFVGRFVKDREALPAIAFTTDTSILTAVGNDYGFDEVFSRQAAALVQPGDIFIGISTSGNSTNVMKAFDVAKMRGAECVLLAGREGGKAMTQADTSFVVRHDVTAHIQECHITLLHMLCSLVEAKMGYA